MDEKISVIIPCLNEEEVIAEQLRAIHKHQSGNIGEIIVSDGGSIDNTLVIAESFGAKIVRVTKAGRAIQMNAGADRAKYGILYFLHADTIPPGNFDRSIVSSIINGAVAGCFTLKFDWNHPALNFYAWFTKRKSSFLRFGDQSLFIKKDTFFNIGGFDESLIVMEDQEIIHRIKRRGCFDVVSQPVITSARKYRENGPVKLQFIFTLIWTGYYLGMPQERLKSFYKRMIRGGQKAR
jgi:rSAM/selenodomain-associated transferase 2